jgi:pimeloyl-ACP methyl ester carboxylesterase
VAVYQITRYVRPYADARENMLDRLRRGTFPHVDVGVATKVLDGLKSLDRDAWASAFMEAARPYEERAQELEAKGDAMAAQEQYLTAFATYRMGRYPTTNSSGRLASYARSVQNYLKAARWFDPPLERVEIPFAQARPGEGDRIIGYWRRPKTAERVPVLIAWGGIDGYKEDRVTEPYLSRGIAVLSVDNQGVGESPIRGGDDAERAWDTILDWVEARPDVDASRVAIIGASTGGYWATKLAHTRSGRIRAAVNHGGCAHYTFEPEWIERAEDGEYVFELAETLAFAFLGVSDFDAWVDFAPSLSLLRQGVLDQPHCALLSVNGKRDSIFTIDDAYLLFEHGDPKWGYFPDVGHMGTTPRTQGIILDWLCDRLEVSR